MVKGLVDQIHKEHSFLDTASAKCKFVRIQGHVLLMGTNVEPQLLIE